MKRLVLLLILFCTFLVPVQAKAADIFGDACSSDHSKASAVCTSQSTADPVSGPNGLLLNVSRVVAIIAGATAVIVIIIGSIRYVTSSGDSNGVNSAKLTIIYALLGLVVIALAESIITFVVGKL